MIIPLSRALFAGTAVLALVAGVPARTEAQNATVISGRVTSAKTGEGVEAAFARLARDMLAKTGGTAV